MYQKPCRLTRADKCYMGGGSAPSVPQQSLGNELGDVLHYMPQFVGSGFNLAGEYGPQFAQQDIDQSKINAPQYAQLGLDLTKQFGPQYAQQGFDIANKLSPQYLGLNLQNMQSVIAGSPLLSSINQQAQSGLQSGGVTDFLSSLKDAAQTGLSGAQANLAKGGIDSYLGNLSDAAQSALKGGGLTPFLQGLSQQAGKLTDFSNTGLTNAYANLAKGGVDPLLGNLTTDAQQQLAQQGHLTPQEAYQATQGTLGAFAGRNNVFNQAEGQAFLDRDALVRQRQQQEQAFAGNVEGQRQGALGLAQSQLGQAQQFGLGTGQLGLGTQGALENALGQAQQFATNIGQQRQGAQGLAQSLLGQQEQFGLGSQGALQNALNQAQQYGLSAQGMDQSALQGLGGAVTPPNYAGYAQAPNLAAYGAPGASYAPMQAGLGTTQGQTQSLLNFGQNLFDANQNAAATQNIAAANKSGGLTGAGIGAAGAIGGGLLAAL